MTDPYRYSDPQTDRINKEIDYQNRLRGKASSYASAQQREKNSGFESFLLLNGINATELPQLLRKALERWYELKDLSSAIRTAERRNAEFSTLEIFAGLALTFNDRLRLNIMSDEIILKSISSGALSTYSEKRDILKIVTENTAGWAYGRLPTYDEVYEYAKEYSFNPVADYLLALPEISQGEGCRIVEELCTKCLGITDPLEKLMVRKTLIAAVARAMTPGCKVQTVLTFTGEQGGNKSTFFEKLFGERFFGHLDLDRDRKEWAITLQPKWALELGELDGFTGKKSAAMLKAFISESSDLYRELYMTRATNHPRHNILVASGNTSEPLTDPTGNRRFWMVKITKSIDLAWIESNRDLVWTAALQLFNSDEKWWFSGEQEIAAKQKAEKSRAKDPWEAILQEFMACYFNTELTPVQAEVRDMLFEPTPHLTSEALLTKLGLPKHSQTTYLKTRLRTVLELLGYENRQKRVGEARLYLWRKANQGAEDPIN